MSSPTKLLPDSQETTIETVTLKRTLEEEDMTGEMNIVGAGSSPKKAKRVIQCSSDDDLMGESTTDVTLIETPKETAEPLIKKAEAEEKRDQYQFERIVLCIQNVRDVASTLQPGYQLTTKIYRDAAGRYNCVAEEDKSADYHFDIKHPPLNKSNILKASREATDSQLTAKLDKVQALAKEMINTEHITIRLVNDSGENIHLLINFAQSSKSTSSSNTQPAKEKPSKK